MYTYDIIIRKKKCHSYGMVLRMVPVRKVSLPLWHMEAKQSSLWAQAQLHDWGSEIIKKGLVDPYQ